MTTVTERLHRVFLDALGDRVVEYGDLGAKPLHLDLTLPLPQHLRVYLYSLVMGSKSRPGEMKVNLRVRHHKVGTYGSFDFSGDPLVLLVGYSEVLGVFVFWDASLHKRFKNGGNVQVKETAVVEAAATGWSEQRRRLVSGTTEVIFACRSDTLEQALTERNSWTGGITE